MIIHLIGSLGIGGAERQLSIISKGVAGRGLEQVIFVLSSASEEVEIDPRVKIVRRASGILATCSFVWDLYRAIVNRRSVTIAWMYHAMLVAEILHLCSLKRHSLVLNFRHSTLQGLRFSTRLVWYGVVVLSSMLKPTAIFNSEAAVSGHGQMLIAKRRIVLPNVIQNFKFDYGRSYPRMFGFIGRNHKDKGADLVPEIIEQLLSSSADWGFLVAGPGTDGLREDVASRLSQANILPDRVRFLGSLANASEFYRMISVLVVPSRTESFPNVVVEAVGHGALVAAMGVGDIRKILRGAYPVANSLNELVSQSLALGGLESQAMQEIATSAYRSVLGPLEPSLVIDSHLDAWRRA